MESFGLFDLFKALLAPNGAENSQAAPDSAQTAQTPSPSAQPTFPEKQTENSNADTPPNAFLDFIHNHDERAKRTKKK